MSTSNWYWSPRQARGGSDLSSIGYLVLPAPRCRQRPQQSREPQRRLGGGAPGAVLLGIYLDVAPSTNTALMHWSIILRVLRKRQIVVESQSGFPPAPCSTRPIHYFSRYYYKDHMTILLTSLVLPTSTSGNL